MADFHPEAKAFTAKYAAAYKTAPDFFASWPYDAVHVLAMAITTAGATDPNKIRQALLAVRGYRGVEGIYNFDGNGDGLHGYNIVKNNDGEIGVAQRIDFND